MVNHPNRSRVLRNRLNILISRIMDSARTPYGQFSGVSVAVRHGYTVLSERALDCAPKADRDPAGRPYFVSLRMPTIWDPAAISNLGRPGAFRVDVDVPAIQAAVDTLRAAWGDIPVQDNSGRCSHLATAPGVLRI